VRAPGIKLSDDFSTFFFDSPSVTTRVNSRQALEVLLVILTAHYGNRGKARPYLSSALKHREPIIEAAGIATFVYGDKVDVPTLGEWLAEQGVTVE
jgi:hypothetical protein